MYSVIKNVSLGMVLGLGLAACGDEDKAKMAAPAAEKEMPAAAAAPAPASSGDDIFSSMNIEKAEGVVYQDEMYAGWPYN